MDILNSREWAILVWVLIAIGYISRPQRWRTLKEPFLGVLHALGSRHLVSAITLMTIYVIAVIYGLSHFGLWDVTQLKGTLIWFFSVALFSLFRIEDFSESPQKLMGLVADSFKLIVLIEYLVGVYTFHFAIEFALIPLVAFLAAAVAYAEGKPEYQSVHKFLNSVMSIIGTVILGSVVYLLVLDIHQIANSQSAFDFIVPVILSTLYTPFMAFMAVYSTYQTVLIRLRYSINKRHVELYARLAAMVIFNIRIKLLKRWSADVAKYRPQTIREVNSSFSQLFQMLAREKSPETISLPEGWSPTQAKNFLRSEGIETGHYNPIDPRDPSEWFCCSTLVEFGSGLFRNNIAYYLNGDERAVKCLKLKLNVNSPEHAEEAHAKLLSTADTLAYAALGLNLREELCEAIIPGEEGTLNGPNFRIMFTKTAWPNKAVEGYDLGVEVSSL
ncbi:hypothetical protein ADIMK_2656 [Marinobacterium lacunae]|uniref:Uncharacterized protein n=1 Tax=Marinobacterium lacunae TaxID=1232683 RepID=A0A081FX77_9GAMM|nr:hypothetical protein [Marinobacterium lacunae]KEA63132.1 hypothetical protein ADIMK_2656 [Marinobacterium lacunae]